MRYRAFNKELGRDRYIEILEMVKSILDNQDKDLNCFWKTITQKQWQELLAIPEAKDFQIGFEFISGQKIEKKEDERGTLLTLTVHQDDLGRAIGKNGKTAGAIRTLLYIFGAKKNIRLSMIIPTGKNETRQN